MHATCCPALGVLCHRTRIMLAAPSAITQRVVRSLDAVECDRVTAAVRVVHKREREVCAPHVGR
jgi:hypothetical protein